MSHLTRYPNQFYQPTPVNGSTPKLEIRRDPEEHPSPGASIPPDPPPLESHRKVVTTSVSAHDLAVLGLDHWSFAHGHH